MCPCFAPKRYYYSVQFESASLLKVYFFHGELMGTMSNYSFLGYLSYAWSSFWTEVGS